MPIDDCPRNSSLTVYRSAYRLNAPIADQRCIPALYLQIALDFRAEQSMHARTVEDVCDEHQWAHVAPQQGQFAGKF